MTFDRTPSTTEVTASKLRALSDFNLARHILEAVRAISPSCRSPRMAWRCRMWTLRSPGRCISR